MLIETLRLKIEIEIRGTLTNPLAVILYVFTARSFRLLRRLNCLDESAIQDYKFPSG